MKKILGNSHQNQIIYFDPGCATLNVGDEIISASARKQLDPLFRDRFIVRLSSHQRVSFRYRRHLNESDYGFVLGSNLLKSNMLFGYRQWDISLLDTLQVGNLVLVGCGWQTYEAGGVDPYSKCLYRRVLSDQFLHSVRDEYTKKKLESIGIRNVVNTGCPTTWMLTSEFCEGIPVRKASQVVCTVTDYRQDPRADSKMLETLKRGYDRVYLWLQGNGDREYVSTLEAARDVTLIPPTLEDYDYLLCGNDDIDYIGTRLHGGIRALQHGKRSLIVSIDNRAREMSKDFNIPTIERNQIDDLEKWIYGEKPTEIRIRSREIKQFLSQFR